jgi:3-hydroxybutyryl-CoA dehydrogenase
MRLEDVEAIAIIGAGQMGQGIAQVCAVAGYRVALCDATLDRAELGRTRILERLQQLEDKGKLSPEARQTAAARIDVAEFEPGVSTVQLVIEAVSEDPALKRQLFERLDRVATPAAVLCSNTSSIPIGQLARATGRHSQVMGMHFMNPVPAMRLLELIRGAETSDETYELVRDLSGRLGKTVVTSQDRPGFIVNRILIPQLNEACFALSEGVATAEDIDSAVVLGLNHPMGPLRLSDWIGLDTVLSIAKVLHEQFGDDKYRPCPLLQKLVDAGALGVKTGRGFYVYEAGKPVGSNSLPK